MLDDPNNACRVRCSISLRLLATTSAVAWLGVLGVVWFAFTKEWLAVLGPIGVVGFASSLRVFRAAVELQGTTVVVRNVWRTYEFQIEMISSASLRASYNISVSLLVFNGRYASADRVRVKLSDGSVLDVFVLAIAETWNGDYREFHDGVLEEICDLLGMKPGPLRAAS